MNQGETPRRDVLSLVTTCHHVALLVVVHDGRYFVTFVVSSDMFLTRDAEEREIGRGDKGRDCTYRVTHSIFGISFASRKA
jgi:hypothetical protein